MCRIAKDSAPEIKALNAWLACLQELDISKLAPHLHQDFQRKYSPDGKHTALDKANYLAHLSEQFASYIKSLLFFVEGTLLECSGCKLGMPVMEISVCTDEGVHHEVVAVALKDEKIIELFNCQLSNKSITHT